MRWWGWGRPGHPRVLPERALHRLSQRLEACAHPRAPVALAEVALPRPALSERALTALDAVVGSGGLRVDHLQRVLHAAGKGYPDLVQLRRGTPVAAPDAVIYPSAPEQLPALLACCTEHDLAVVPFGGGTSVVGGVAPLRGEHAAVISVDLRRLDQLTGLDRPSGIVTCAAGLRVPALEAELSRAGLTLGHFPQSYEYVSVGGCAATRSAGQASTGYGRFDDLVLGLRCLTPSGDLALEAVPASAAGPDLRELVLGSEGTLGFISELALRVRPAPERRVYEGFFFETFAAGVEGVRQLAVSGAKPDVVRLSDEAETRLSLLLAGDRSVKARGARAYLDLRGYAGGCLAILGFEGASQEVGQRRARAGALLRRAAALRLGRGVGEAWVSARFAGPYLRDDLLGHGLLVETLETATRWSELDGLRHAVAAAIDRSLRERGTAGVVMCHVSHVYTTGASLYFTVLAPQQAGEELEQWAAVKRAASEAIVAHRATITHHHAVGRDHAPWLGREIGPRGIAALRALKTELDPAGLMNPGKLIDR
jgi:alkyldihydroxyacetonephosphate synthase